MIEPSLFYDRLTSGGIDFFAGVPDSLLKSLCAYVTDTAAPDRHVIAANEGSAVALAAGHHLATGGIPLVYMQNSGIGNAVNPLLSLVDPDVYGIPLVLAIGWRGEPGVHDEPQHKKQGKVTLALLDAMGIPYSVVSGDPVEFEAQAKACVDHVRSAKSPYALVVKKDAFAPYELKTKRPVEAEMTREEAIERVMLAQGAKDAIVSTTGMASRELCELREKHGMGHERDFLTVGSMGHASQIALALAMRKPGRRVTCLDGDGALIMQMGGLATIGDRKPANLGHVVLNNGAHDSVGGQPTVALGIDVPALALALGYRRASTARTRAELDAALAAEFARSGDGPALIEVRVRKGSRKDLGRPKASPEENKRALMDYLKD